MVGYITLIITSKGKEKKDWPTLPDGRGCSWAGHLLGVFWAVNDADSTFACKFIL